MQVILVFADTQDSANKAASEFAKAYFAFNKQVLSERICETSKMVDDVNVVDKYIYEAAQEANARGFNLGCYIKNKIYHMETETLSRESDKASIRIKGERKSPLRTFFSKGDIHEFDEVLELVKEDGKWKVCGNPFSISGV
ncbi:Uncharacterized protein dnl_05830 [Desulfonema limicola]|uniref:Uncharacterized protein n=1 Tax=Desulfonema limicola TaxID=45656 RepID=A0A975B402_9BACT|nr:Uncharacterized protein dnl_05830 [Desulfonema limicola]